MPFVITQKIKRPSRLFVAVVVAPTALAILYFGLFASDIYVSESKFVVRSPEKPAASGLGVILKTAGFANAGDEIYAAQSYAVSRDALRAINRDGAFERAFTRPHISIFDRFNPLGSKWSGSFEYLYKLYQGKVRVSNDSTSSITTLEFRAYTAEDAHMLNERLLETSEALVNKLNKRGRNDLIQAGLAEVAADKAKASEAAAALAAYRNMSGVLDPEKQAEVQMQMISKLQDELIATKTQLLQLQTFTAENPQIPFLRQKINSLKNEIAAQLGHVVGNRRSLAASAGQYQRLLLENEFAAKQLAGAMSSLDEARNEAGRKQAYVERIVEPNLPDAPIEPQRLRGIFATLALSLVIFGILKMLLAGVREHAQ